MRKYSDEETLEIIRKLLNGEGTEEEIESWFENELEEFMPGISDLIFYSEEGLSPEQILQRARELSKPILL